MIIIMLRVPDFIIVEVVLPNSKFDDPLLNPKLLRQIILTESDIALRMSFLFGGGHRGFQTPSTRIRPSINLSSVAIPLNHRLISTSGFLVSQNQRLASRQNVVEAATSQSCSKEDYY
jgi:hypothetical protein